MSATCQTTNGKDVGDGKEDCCCLRLIRSFSKKKSHEMLMNFIVTLLTFFGRWVGCVSVWWGDGRLVANRSYGGKRISGIVSQTHHHGIVGHHSSSGEGG